MINGAIINVSVHSDSLLSIQSQVTSSYSDISRDLYILPRKNACVIRQVFFFLSVLLSGPVACIQWHIPLKLSNNPSLFLYVLALSLEALLFLSLTSHLRSGFTLTWFDFQWTIAIALHLSPSVIKHLFVFLIPWCQRLSIISISVVQNLCKSHRALI